MKYESITLNPRMGVLTYKDSKEIKINVYPRLNRAEVRMMNLLPSAINCILVIRQWSEYIALKQIDRANSEHLLYVDLTGVDSHYYKNVILELGEAQKKGSIWLVPATFTSLEPYLYDAATHEVVY